MAMTSFKLILSEDQLKQIQEKAKKENKTMIKFILDACFHECDVELKSIKMPQIKKRHVLNEIDDDLKKEIKNTLKELK